MTRAPGPLTRGLDWVRAAEPTLAGLGFQAACGLARPVAIIRWMSCNLKVTGGISDIQFCTVQYIMSLVDRACFIACHCAIEIRVIPS